MIAKSVGSLREESVEIPMHPALLRFLAWPRREEGAYPRARPPTRSLYSPPPPRRSVTDEQRRPGQKAEQPNGRERFGASGGVARSLQTTEEAEGNRGGRYMGEPAGLRVARALPSAPKHSRAGCMGISTDSLAKLLPQVADERP